jgi:hypothetical protein
MKNLIVFIGILTTVTSCMRKSKMEIVQFNTYTKEADSLISLNKMRVYYNYFFLVKNYSDKTESNASIDSFSLRFLKYGKYSPNREEIRIWFYKETSKTNIEAIRANPREVDRYSNEHDLIWCYTLFRNNFIKKDKFKNGEVEQTNLKSITTSPKIETKKKE